MSVKFMSVKNIFNDTFPPRRLGRSPKMSPENSRGPKRRSKDLRTGHIGSRAVTCAFEQSVMKLLINIIFNMKKNIPFYICPLPLPDWEVPQEEWSDQDWSWSRGRKWRLARIYKECKILNKKLIFIMQNDRSSIHNFQQDPEVWRASKHHE